MKATDAGFVALRIAGLVLAAWVLLGLVSAMSFLQWGDTEGADVAWLGWVQIAALLVVLSVALYLFTNARALAVRLFGGVGDLEVTGPHKAVQAVAFSVVGVFVAATALPSMALNLTQFLWVLRAGAELEREQFLDFGTFLDVLYNLFSLAVGAFLFFRSSWLANLWSRHAG